MDLKIKIHESLQPLFKKRDIPILESISLNKSFNESENIINMKEEKQLYPINYLGKTYNTTIHSDMTDEEYNEVVNGLMSKPSIDEVKTQLKKVAEGGTRIDKIYNYYFKDIAYKVKLVYNNWSIDEAIKYKPLMEFFKGKSETNKKVYPDSMPLWKKIETAFRMAGFKTCSKPSNFPIQTIDKLLETYCKEDDNYYDFSCGWGVRLLSALKHKVNYFGTDPNSELVPRLNAITSDFKDEVGNYSSVDIKCTGSEIYQSEWQNKMDFIFSSPPYFNLEDYRIGNGQSYKEGETTYEMWLNDYVKPTIENCYNYLKDDGIFAFNIKNNFKYIKHDMEGDWDRIANECGFEKIDEVDLVNITRVSGHKHSDGSANTMEVHENNEIIRIYKKK